MQPIPVFLSVVVVVRNQSSELDGMVREISDSVSQLVSDYEVIIVDNASRDNSLETLRSLTSEKGVANLQVYALTKEVDNTTATWVGVESSLGDFVGSYNPHSDSIAFLPEMLAKALGGMDVVFAVNKFKKSKSLYYRLAQASFNKIYKYFNGINLDEEAPDYRILSRSLINFILQHAQPVIAYRHLPATGGFARAVLRYNTKPKTISKKTVQGSIDRGIGLMLSTSRAPMRLVTALCLFGAISNVIYSIYVIAVAIWKPNVAPGWTTLSLQQSGMFFLLSLVLLVLSEYILQMLSLSNSSPLYHVAQEFTSAKMSRLKKLNVEDARQYAVATADFRGE